MKKNSLNPLQDIHPGTFTIKCNLLIDGSNTCWLAESYESYLSGERKKISPPNVFLNQIFSDLPPYGGGKVIYCETCILTIDYNGSDITYIHKIIVQREEFEAIWEADSKIGATGNGGE